MRMILSQIPNTVDVTQWSEDQTVAYLQYLISEYPLILSTQKVGLRVEVMRTRERHEGRLKYLSEHPRRRGALGAAFTLTALLAAVALPREFPFHDYLPGIIAVIGWWIIVPAALQRWRLKFHQTEILMSWVRELEALAKTANVKLDPPQFIQTANGST